MTKQTEALKMAIEWMEKYHQMHIIEMEVGERWIDLSMAIQVCKEALDTEQVREDDAQPAQEPVLLNVKTHDDKTYKVEVSAPSWQGLTDSEIVWLCPPFYDEDNLIANEVGFARAIEQALKEKNNV